MLLNYTPEGADKQVFTFVPAKLMSSEAEAIEKVTHMTYVEFQQALVDGSMAARRALLWVFKKRTEPMLQFSQIDFPAGAVEMEWEQHELKTMRDEAMVSRTLTDEERIALLSQLDEQIVDDEVEAPKVIASSDASPD